MLASYNAQAPHLWPYSVQPTHHISTQRLVAQITQENKHRAVWTLLSWNETAMSECGVLISFGLIYFYSPPPSCVLLEGWFAMWGSGARAVQNVIGSGIAFPFLDICIFLGQIHLRKSILEYFNKRWHGARCRSDNIFNKAKLQSLDHSNSGWQREKWSPLQITKRAVWGSVLSDQSRASDPDLE